jgi:hypothetical protein
MAESSTLLRAPLRNWFGWCFTTRLFRGLGVGVGWAVSVSVGFVDSGVSSGSGVPEMGRILGGEVAAVATAVVRVDCVGSGVGSDPSVLEVGRTLGGEVASCATVVVIVDRVGGEPKIIFSIPQIETKITIR